MHDNSGLAFTALIVHRLLHRKFLHIDRYLARDKTSNAEPPGDQ